MFDFESEDLLVHDAQFSLFYDTMVDLKNPDSAELKFRISSFDAQQSKMITVPF